MDIHSLFSLVNTCKRNDWSYNMHLLNFKKKWPNSLSTLFIYQLHPYQQSDMRSSSSIPLLTLAIVFLITDILVAVKWYLIKISICISLTSSGHVWMWELGHKTERWRIDAFELWCWRRLLRVPWTAWRSNQSILKEISPRYSLEGLMLKLKFQYFGNLMRGADSFERPWCWERLRAGGDGDNRGWDGCMASPTQWTWVWVNSRSWW